MAKSPNIVSILVSPINVVARSLTGMFNRTFSSSEISTPSDNNTLYLSSSSRMQTSTPSRSENQHMLNEESDSSSDEVNEKHKEKMTLSRS